jgi:hypothetical protein
MHFVDNFRRLLADGTLQNLASVEAKFSCSEFPKCYVFDPQRGTATRR